MSRNANSIGLQGKECRGVRAFPESPSAPAVYLTERPSAPVATPRGFTLLEVMLAVAIIGMISVSIFRFVDSTLRVVQAISQSGGGNEEIEALCRTVQFQLNDLPITEAGAILGQAHIFNATSLDEFQWLGNSGNSLFTAYAPGDYRVTLMVQEDAKAKTSELGIRRVLISGNQNTFNWVPLVPGIKAMEARYFDLRNNSWLEKWTDPGYRPNLVRLKFWRDKDADPYEVILSIPRVGNNGPPPPPPPPRPR